jgi:serine protease Do
MKAVDEITMVAFRVQRTDSAINSGNSGGGLFNSNGELIGIVNAKISSSEIENIGYAIPSNIAIGAAQNIIDNCDGTSLEKIQKPILGVTVRITESSSIIDDNQMFLSIINGITVDSFSAGSLAYSKGLRVGDKLLKVQINGTQYKLDRLFILSDLLFNVKVNETIIITLERMVDGVATEMAFEIGIIADCITAIE